VVERLRSSAMILPLFLLAYAGLAFASDQRTLLEQPPDITFSREWQILGPFEIGTRGNFRDLTERDNMLTTRRGYMGR